MSKNSRVFGKRTLTLLKMHGTAIKKNAKHINIFVMGMSRNFP
jgi:hypothetical protein